MKTTLTFVGATLMLIIFGVELFIDPGELWARLVMCGFGLVGVAGLGCGCWAAEEIIFDGSKIN